MPKYCAAFGCTNASNKKQCKQKNMTTLISISDLHGPEI